MTTPPPEKANDHGKDSGPCCCDREIDSDSGAPSGTLPNRRLSRSGVNFWVDAATAVAIAAMLGTGILLKWVLPPGIRGGRGLSWLGEGRHYWGDVHFWISVVLVVLLVFHLVLHWSWITACWRRFAGSLKSPVTWAILAFLALLITLPVLIPAEGSSSGGRYGRGRGAAAYPAVQRDFSAAHFQRTRRWARQQDDFVGRGQRGRRQRWE